MRTLLTLLLLTAPVAAAPVPKALKKAAPALDGTWQLVESHVGEFRAQLTDDIRWEIEGERLTVTSTRQAVPDGFVANATRTISKAEGGAANAVVYTINFTDGNPSSVRPAVLELNGDTFTICLADSHNGPRPPECKPTQGAMTYTLKRMDAKAK